jgi:hypothetical protein
MMPLTEHTYCNSMIGIMFENRGGIHHDVVGVCVCVSRASKVGGCGGKVSLGGCARILGNNFWSRLGSSVRYGVYRGVDRHIKMNYENELQLLKKSVKSQRHHSFDRRKSRD